MKWWCVVKYVICWSTVVAQCTLAQSCPKVVYTEVSTCAGRESIEVALNLASSETLLECMLKCEETFQCIAIFYNKLGKDCKMYSKPLSNHTTITQVGTKCYQVEDATLSWVVEVTIASSNKVDYPPAHMLGAPDDFGWVPYDVNQVDFIELRFSPEMFVEEVTIHEYHQPGGISRVKLLTPEGNWDTVWSSDYMIIFDFDRAWKPEILVTHFKTANVRLDIGSRNAWECIDAVRVMGRRERLGVRMIAYLAQIAH